MGIINSITKRCIFCKSKKGSVYISAYGMYGEECSGNWYHKACLIPIVCAPEEHNSRLVDMAVDIVNRIETTQHIKTAKRKHTTERCNYLKQYCSTLE